MPYSTAPETDRAAAWSWARVRTLTLKEWADVYRNRRLIVLTFLLPLLLVLVPLFGFRAVERAPERVLQRDEAPLVGRLVFPDGTLREQIQGALASQFLTLFLLVPLSVPVSMATYSIVGEKRDRSLEPLLATPLRTGELLAGKALGAAVPGVLATLLGYACYALAARPLVVSERVYDLVLGPLALAVVCVLGPLVSLLGVGFALIVSSRSTDPRAAEQVSLMLIMPLLGLLVAQLFGTIQLGLPLLAVVALVLVVLDALLFRVAIRLFERGAILSRWG